MGFTLKNYKEKSNYITEKKTIKMDTLEAIAGYKYFIDNPDDLLGEDYDVKGIHGIAKQRRGDKKTAVAKIGAPINKLVIPDVNFSPAVSVIETDSKQPEPDEAQRIVQEIEDNTKRIAESAIKKTKAESQDPTDLQPPKEIFTFAETYEQTNRINPALPAVGSNRKMDEQELRAYVWYMEQIGRKMSPKWYELAGFRSMDADGEVDIKEWLRQGILWYYRGDYLPGYAYFSGNLYDKSTALESDRDAIIQIYGIEIYELQKSKFEKIFSEKVYDSRLRINPEILANQLILLPNSDFSQTFMIETIEGDTEIKFEGYIHSLGSKAKVEKGIAGKPNWEKESGRYHDRKTFNELSLRDAFQYWLKQRDGGSRLIKKNLSWLDIISFYLESAPYNEKRDGDRETFTRTKSFAKQEGDRLFMHFLKILVRPEDQLRIETQWNRDNNAIIECNFDKIPVAFEYGKIFYNSAMDIRWEKRESVAFMSSQGSGLLAHQVGIGKTISAIMTIKHFIEAGWCKRPFIVVPNQTYKTWLTEIRQLLPVEIMKINDFYNLGVGEYREKLNDVNGQVKMVDEGSISVFTYEGFEKLGFGESTLYELEDELYDIIYQVDEVTSEKKAKARGKKIEELMGAALSKTRVEIEKLGFDFMVVDEAHNMKKIFTSVKGKSDAKKQYDISTGSPSAIGLKGFCIAQYIQNLKDGRNVMLLTATPFTNSSLEVFSMLSLVSYRELKNLRLNNLNDFFDMFCMSSYELKISAKMMKPERKQEVVGWSNIQALQKIIFRFMNYKEGDHVDGKGRIIRLDRPQKYILPYERVLVDGMITELPEDQVIKTSLTMTEQQKILMGEIRDYVVDGVLPTAPVGYTEEDDVVDETPEAHKEVEIHDNKPEATEKTEKKTEIVTLDYSKLKDDEKAGVRIMQGVGWSRSLAISPYLFTYSGLGKPSDYLDFIESSPKMLYTMQCIANVKKYHEDHKEPVSGQIIYMDRGKDYFHLLKEYLVKVIGYNENEVGIISGQTKDRNMIQNLFNGERYDDAAGYMLPIADKDRIKIIIGSRAIREGMNLQKRSSVLYNLYVDWNPTDQAQLEGRIWRQKSQFKFIRIVLPLMIDSMDIFMFQKLEVKTKRINQIWDRDGKTNVIEIEKLDPKEQKYNLITDARILAEMEVDDEKDRLTDDKASLAQKVEILEGVVSLYFDVKNGRDKWLKIVNIHRPIYKDGNLKARTDSAIVAAIEDIAKTQLDSKGEPFKDQSKYSGYYGMDYVSDGSFDIPWGFADWKISVKQLAKKEVDLLKPLHITTDPDDIQSYIKKLETEMEGLGEKIKEVSGANAMQHRIARIRKEQEKRKLGKVTPDMRVVEFEKMNYLLSEVKIKTGEHKAWEDLIDPKVCPPMDVAGNRRIDKEAQIQLEYCVERLPDTKKQNTVADGVYTEERELLHRKIIYDLYKGIACVHRDQPICVLTAGAPGSGKSHFLKYFAPYMLSDKIIKIDADAIREKLPEYKGWNANMTHSETRDIVSEALSYVSTPCKHDLLYDGTMNTPSNYEPLIAKLRTLGYKIYIVFVDVPKEYSKKRILERYQRSGRYTPLSVVDEFYAHAPNYFDKIKTLVDGWIEVDGITAEIKPPIHGEPIPQDREYFSQDMSTLPSELEKVEKIAEEAATKSEMQSALKGAIAVAKFLEGEEKADMEAYAKGLKRLIMMM